MLKTTNKQVDIQVILLSLHSKPPFLKWRLRKIFIEKDALDILDM